MSDPGNGLDFAGDEVADANHSSPCSHGDSDPQAASESVNAKPNSDADQLPGPPPSSSTSSEALAKVISSLIGSVIRDFDSKAEEASRSQDQLSSAIDRLTGELDQLLEDAPSHSSCSMLQRYLVLEKEFHPLTHS
ncbi:hypothetical protein Dimus_037249 [Dionaea muscipula]